MVAEGDRWAWAGQAGVGEGLADGDLRTAERTLLRLAGRGSARGRVCGRAHLTRFVAQRKWSQACKPSPFTKTRSPD